jgi:hypothetical protein
VQVLETENKHLVEANKQLVEEKQIQKEMCENSLIRVGQFPKSIKKNHCNIIN